MRLLVSTLLSLFLLALNHQLPFFWDAVQLGAKQAIHFYEGGGWLLSDDIDSGHPPGFGAYISLWWQAFGRTLFVSHLALLPWIILLFYQLLGICQQLLGQYWFWGFLLLMVEPVLLGQLLIVSPDIILVSAFFSGICLIIKQSPYKSWGLLAIVILLSVISTRAWMAALALFLLDLFLSFSVRESKKKILPFFTQKLLPFIPGGLIAIIYLAAHYQAKGWISFHPDSPWAASFDAVSFSGIIKNTGLVGWRLIDLGRLIGCIAILVSFFKIGSTTLWKNLGFRSLLLGLVLFLGIISPMIVVRTGLTGPRYLLPAILLIDLLAAYCLLSPILPSLKWRKPLFLVTLLALCAGNFLVYPHRIAQAWDASPVHYPYYSQVESAIHFLTQKNINLNEVGTVFPSVGPRDWRLLNNNNNGFKTAQLDSDRFLFVSMVHNDWSDEQLDIIENPSNWEIIWERSHPLGIWSRLYRRIDLQ